MFNSRSGSRVIAFAAVVICAISLPATAADTLFTMHLAAWAGEDAHPGFLLDSTGAVLQEFPHTDDYVHGVAAAGNDLYVSEWGYKPIVRYNATTNGWDTVLALSLGNYADGILGRSPEGIVAEGGFLYIGIPDTSSVGASRIVKYTTSGTLVNANLVTGLTYPGRMAVKGDLLYVTDAYTNTVGVYNATSGAVVNAALITDPAHWVSYRAVSGVTVTDDAIYTITGRGLADNYIGKFKLDGTPVNTELYYGMNCAHDIRVSGDTLYVVGGYSDWGWVAKYSTDGSSAEQPIASLGGDAYGLAIVPEPATLTLLALGGLALIRRRRS